MRRREYFETEEEEAGCRNRAGCAAYVGRSNPSREIGSHSPAHDTAHENHLSYSLLPLSFAHLIEQQDYAAECAISSRPFTVFRWRPGNEAGRFKLNPGLKSAPRFQQEFNLKLKEKSAFNLNLAS